MGFLDNLFSAPKQQEAAPAQQTAPQQQAPANNNQANPQDGQNTNVPGSGATPNANGQIPGTQQGVVNPLDAYKTIWDNPAKTDEAPSFNLDPSKIKEVSSSLNFTRDLPPELLQRAQSGDAAALLEAMNYAAQQAYATALHHGSTLTDKYVNVRSEHDSKKINSTVRSELTQSALASNPQFNHPAVKGQLTAIAERLHAQNPGTPPQQIAEMAKQYIIDMANAINPPKESAQTQEAAKAVNWDEFLGQ